MKQLDAVGGLVLAMARIVQKYRAGIGAPPAGVQENNMDRNGPTLGDLIHVFYEELVAEYKDEELASVIAAALVNEMILTGNRPDQEIAAA
jgi:hypothetical protein